jgi:hypothetical protein
MSISAGTVCVQMGHNACPLVWFWIIVCIISLSHLIGRSTPSKSCTEIVKNLKYLYPSSRAVCGTTRLTLKIKGLRTQAALPA